MSFAYSNSVGIENETERNEVKRTPSGEHFLGRILLDILTTLCNVFIGAFGMAIVEIKNETDSDIIVSLSGRQGTENSNIFDEDEIWNWDLYIIRSKRGRIFTMGIGKRFHDRALFMLNGVGLIARKSFFTFNHAVITMSRNKDQLKFISSHVGIVVTEESFIKIVDRESLTRDDEITFGVNEDSSGRGNADKVFVWNKKIATAEDMFAYAVSYDTLNDEEIAKNLALMKRLNGSQLEKGEMSLMDNYSVEECNEPNPNWKKQCEQYQLNEIIEAADSEDLLKTAFLICGLFLYAFEYRISRKNNYWKSEDEQENLDARYVTDEAVVCDIFDARMFGQIGREVFNMKIKDDLEIDLDMKKYFLDGDNEEKQFDAKIMMVNTNPFLRIMFRSIHIFSIFYFV